MRLSLLVLFLTASLVTGCGEKSAPVLTTGPTFDPLVFFQGHTQSWGIIESRSGVPVARIVTESQGEKTETDRLRMVQHLTYQDGKTQERDWVLWRSGPGQFDATANDMVSTAKGTAEGRMFHWEWILARSPGNSLMNVTMSQWMYQMDDGSVMIRTTISKLGVILAEVSEQFTHT